MGATSAASSTSVAPAAPAPAAAPATPNIEPHLREKVKAAPPTTAAPAPATPAVAAPAAPVAPVEDPKQKQHDEQFQQLLRRSKGIHDRETVLKAQEKELEEARALKKRLADKDYSVITEHGGSLEEWSERWLEEHGGDNPVAKELRATKKQITELSDWKAKQEETAKTEAQKAEEAKHAATIQGYRKEIDDYLTASTEHKLLAIAGLGHEVYNVIEKHAQRTQQELGTPQILKTEEAAKYVLQYYRPRIVEQMKQILALPDFQDVLTEITKPKAAPPVGGNPPVVPAVTPPEQEDEGLEARPASTLTSQMAATAPPRGAAKLTREERRRATKATLRFS